MVDEQTLKKALLVGKKSDRIIFAVTPEMKEVVAMLAEENCTTVSGYITSLIVDDAIEQREKLFSQPASGFGDSAFHLGAKGRASLRQ